VRQRRLKIIKPGMDSRQVIARFEAERQALAMMDHQNIAKVLDAASTDSGRPYFVMELVHGVPLTKYCDDRKLTPRQRLELFLPVCHAVQHAHQKGIIHRDLKPSNILVTMYDDKPVPKVIDFGVAKAVEQRLTEKTLFTQFGTLVGTFEYMSPEQAEMNAFGVDTRSDVYSLGVMLYELLTGSTPLQRQRLPEAAYGEIVRLIKEEEPPRPSTRLSSSGAALADISQHRGSAPEKLTRLVRGELDWIVMRCLEKNRARRYEAASGLARDIERYLRDEPVEACPPTAGYRLRKFARKHQTLLATAAAFAALLLLGVAASAWQAVRATQAEVAALANEQQANANAAQANEQRDDAQQQRDKVRALNDKLRRTLYTAHMNLARHAWEAGGIERMQELLEQHRPKAGEPDLRRFEWHYLYRLGHVERLILGGRPFGGNCVAYSPDGERLASGGNGEIKLWDAQTGQNLSNIKWHNGGVISVAFSPDGKRLASASFDKMVKVWDVQTGWEILSLPGHTLSVSSVCFSPNGARLASASADTTVKVWDAQTGQELLTIRGHTGALHSLAFSPDGKCLASASRDTTVKVWDARTGQELLSLKGGGMFSSVAFSPDGKRLATANMGGIKVWDAQTGQELLAIQGVNSDGFGSVAFSPDGKRLASGSSSMGPLGETPKPGEVKVWDAQTGQELVTLKGHTGSGVRVVFSPDGKHLASCADNTVRLWDVQTRPNPRVLKGEAGSVASVAFSPDGKRLTAGSSNGPIRFGDINPNRPGDIKVWDAQTGQELPALKGHTGSVSSVTVSPDGKRLASAGGGEVKVWDAQTGQELLSLNGTRCVAFSPDSQRLASASKSQGGQGNIKVWDAQTGQELLAVNGYGGGVVRSLAFSPDGQRLATTGSVFEGNGPEGVLKVWDAQTGQELWRFKEGGGFNNSVVFSPGGQCLAMDYWDTVKVWDAQTGQELLTLKGHTGGINCVAFSPDGQRLATAAGDKTVKVWDGQTGQELLTLQGHTSGVNSVAFSPDGHQLASGSNDGTVRIWDATPLPEKSGP
jgi:WD40 repeat protein